MNELFSICIKTLFSAFKALHLADDGNRRESARNLFKACNYISKTGFKIMRKKAMSEKQLYELISTSLRLSEMLINVLSSDDKEYRLSVAEGANKISNILHGIKWSLLVDGINKSELAKLSQEAFDEMEQQRSMMN